MSDILEKQIVLSLNANWQPVGWKTVKLAIKSLCPEEGKESDNVALDIEINDKGELANATPVEWDDWVNLPVRPQDLAIQTKSRAIRAPLVVVARGYSQMPLKEPVLSKEAILKRDGYTDQYSGEKMPRSELNVDHVIPKDKGGKDTWENMVACCRRRNFAKSNRTNEEVGYKLIRKPVRPPRVPASFLIGPPRNVYQAPFLKS